MVQQLTIALVGLLQLWAIVVSGTIACAQSDKSSLDVVDETNWLEDSSFGVDIRINAEMLRNREPYRSVGIYVFIGAKDFTEENLRKVFEGFSDLVPGTDQLLTVTAISDIGVLEKMSSVIYLTGGEPSAFVPGHGHFGAFFSRNLSGEETFLYTQSAAKAEWSRVILKGYEASRDRRSKSDLREAALTGDTVRLNELFTEGEGIKFRNILRFTPLIYAAREGSAGCAEKIIADGADVNARNIYGRTALLEAALGGNTDIIKVLLKHRADSTATDNHQNSALMLAVYGNHFEAAKTLITNGADIHVKNEFGLSAFAISRQANRNQDLIRLVKARPR